MRMRIRHCLVAAVMVASMAVPSSARAQTDVPPVIFTGPLSHMRYDDGGIYSVLGFRMMKSNRALKWQEIAVRGFFDQDGAITGSQYALIGSGESALTTSQLYGPGANQPGWDLRLGYRFQNGLVVELQWLHLVEARYHAQAALIPPSFNVGNIFQNTFISQKVSNFTNEFAGNDTNVPIGTSATTFGIWNAASFMSIELVQRFDIYGVNARIPIWQTDNYRSYGIFGPRIVWIFDRFQWRTVDQDEQGNAGPDTTAIYSNTVSNRLYGVHCGCGNDYWLGNTPIGGFAFTLDFEGGIYLDIAKTRAAYDRADHGAGTRRSRIFHTLAPGAEVRAGLWWYPWEGISIQVGYDIQTYFNTMSSPRPVDFNVGSVNPEYEHQFFRWWHGLYAGINFVF